MLLQDGGIGDADGIANGIIVDPSGVGAEETQISTGGGDGNAGNGNIDGASCFISAAGFESRTNQPADARYLFQILCLVLACLILPMIYGMKSNIHKMRVHYRKKFLNKTA